MLDDFSEGRGIVPDLRSYSEGVEAIDFAAEGYMLVISDPDNTLLEVAEEKDDEAGDERAGAETRILAASCRLQTMRFDRG